MRAHFDQRASERACMVRGTFHSRLLHVNDGHGARVHLDQRASKRACMLTHTHTHGSDTYAEVYVFACACSYAWGYVCMCVCLRLRVRVSLQARVHARVHAHRFRSLPRSLPRSKHPPMLHCNHGKITADCRGRFGRGSITPSPDESLSTSVVGTLSWSWPSWS